MKTINIYTENEIDILKAFYKEKVINKTLNSSSPFKITDLVSYEPERFFGVLVNNRF